MTEISFNKHSHTLILKNQYIIYSINIEDIYFFEKFGRKIDVVLYNKRITYYGTFKDLEKIINSNYFYKCHKSYIINFKKVFMIDKDEIIFFDIKDIAIVSKNNRNELTNIISNI
ncbi:LytR/AlgR family response regulator transcription factor [Anaerocolumna sp.]|uniref:LytR/AlgR family response regulator transcription factor n=1 Tax=Anaerocolumna sp. TaxID=2041569 RepID=UPI0028B15DA7|nr:LytTR family DNA-binding domain-containing protein [Anaerocolumna sp.]